MNTFSVPDLKLTIWYILLLTIAPSKQVSRSFIQNCHNVDLTVSSLVAQLVKNLPAMQETWVQSWGWEDPLEKGKLPTPVF